MARYTVKQLARLSGVSVRALHHYDEIGLLKPAFIGENRYRYYGREELLRLQDILFHRELGVPLGAIAGLIEQLGNDRVAALEAHRVELLERLERSRRLVRTIDRTIAEIKGDKTMKDDELYQGFSPEKQVGYEAELIERFGPGVREGIKTSRIAWDGLDDAGKQARIAEYGDVEERLAALLLAGVAPDSVAAEPLLARHRAWVASMWNANCSPKSYGGLGSMYTDHPDFRARFDAIEPGFAEWFAAAMRAHAARHAQS
jgi:DNA-binding transcriptional MerR regulator